MRQGNFLFITETFVLAQSFDWQVSKKFIPPTELKRLHPACVLVPVEQFYFHCLKHNMDSSELQQSPQVSTLVSLNLDLDRLIKSIT